MKTDTAIIRLVQITSRAKADGTFPIVLRIQYNGRKERYSPVSVPKKFWDADKEVVKKNYPNAVSLNTILHAIKDEAIKKKLYYEQNKQPYTAAMLLEENNYLCGNDLVFPNLYNRKIKEYSLKYNTIKNYELTFNLLSDYLGRADFLVTEINEGVLNRFCKQLRDTGRSNGSINTICSKIASIWHYAISLGLCEEKQCPFNRFKYSNKYKKSNNKRALNREMITSIENYFMSHYIIVDQIQGLLSYTQEAWNNLQKRYSEETALALFISCYRFQGLAFTDLAKIHVSQVEIRNIKGEEYYIFRDIYRSKTNQPVPIAVERSGINYAIIA